MRLDPPLPRQVAGDGLVDEEAAIALHPLAELIEPFLVLVIEPD
jgi:hypothetical protein